MVIAVVLTAALLGVVVLVIRSEAPTDAVGPAGPLPPPADAAPAELARAPLPRSVWGYEPAAVRSLLAATAAAHAPEQTRDVTDRTSRAPSEGSPGSAATAHGTGTVRSDDGDAHIHDDGDAATGSRPEHGRARHEDAT